MRSVAQCGWFPFGTTPSSLTSFEASPYRARASRFAKPAPPNLGGALHKKSWAVIDRPYSLGSATVGALYERPRSIFCAKPLGGSSLLEFSPHAAPLFPLT